MNPHTGAIVILAYPEEFVSMIPAWYRKPMEWVGMVNHGKIAAGHSAMALINKATGKIHYGDFGRYVTKFGNGRTRMAETDPDVAFDYKVQFHEGEIVNKTELFEQFYKHPEKTHGGDVMYISLNQDVDFDSCYHFMKTMNAKGSILYDPFGAGRSNCSRFVYDSILSGASSDVKKKLKRKTVLTPSPLGNVFHGTNDDSYFFSPQGNKIVTDKSIRVVIKHLFKKAQISDLDPESEHEKRQRFLGLNPKNKWSYLGGIGDQAYVLLKEVQQDVVHVEKYGADHSLTFQRTYKRHSDFLPDQDFEFIHDCNSSWITIQQGGKILRMDVTS